MNKNLIIVIAVAVIAILLYSSYNSLEINGGTDFPSTDTIVTDFEYDNPVAECNLWGCTTKTLNPKGYSQKELIEEDYIVTAWNDMDKSETIHVSDNNAHGICPTGASTNRLAMETACPMISKPFWTVQIMDASGDWQYVTTRDGVFDNDIINDDDVHESDFGWQTPHYNPNSPGICGYIEQWTWQCAADPDIFQNRVGWVLGTQFSNDLDAKEIISIDPISFEITGAHNTWLRVKLQSYFLWFEEISWVGDLPNCDTSKGELVTWVQDDVRLECGSGTIDFDAQSYEEGELVTLNVDTDYSGGHDNSKHWRVRIEDPDGAIVDIPGITFTLPDGTTTDYGDFLLGDDTTGEITFTVPQGTIEDQGWSAGGRWEVHLINTILQKDKDWAWVTIEGLSQTGPKKPTIEIGEVDEGNQLTITVYADARDTGEGGTGEVSQFYIDVERIYGSGHFFFYEGVWTASHQGGSEYGAQDKIDIPFSTTKDIVVHCTAVDNRGIPSEEETEGKTIDPDGDPDDYLLEFHVTYDNEPVNGATISIEGVTLNLETDFSGYESISLPKGQTYDITVSYHSDIITRSVYLSKNGQDEYFDFGMPINFIISLAVIAIVITICAVIAFLIPLHIAYRMLIIMAGIIASIFIYLIMNGIL